MHSIILTIHNKDWMIEKVVEGICKNTTEPYELIVVIDGCTDNTESVVLETLSGTNIDFKLIFMHQMFLKQKQIT
jgi:glycosyltransferase involved in cell wall biosynthesis